MVVAAAAAAMATCTKMLKLDSPFEWQLEIMTCNVRGRVRVIVPFLYSHWRAHVVLYMFLKAEQRPAAASCTTRGAPTSNPSFALPVAIASLPAAFTF